MNKLFFLIGSILVLISVVLFFWPNQNQEIQQEIFTSNTPLIIESKMQLALNQTEKDTLSAEWNGVRDNFNNLKIVVTKINSTSGLNTKDALEISRFLELVSGASNTIDEIKNEIKYPAESVDEKIASVIGIAPVLEKLSEKIQPVLEDNNLKQAEKELMLSSNSFLSKINIFKSDFFDAIKLPEGEISDDLRKALTPPINESAAAGFSQYDGRRFFNEIQDTTKQVAKEYQIKIK